MAIYTDTLPQKSLEIKTVTLKDLISALPEVLPVKKNFWISGRLARFGVTHDNLVFLVEQEKEPDSSIKTLFSPYVKKMGLSSTVSHHWKNQRLNAIRLYDNGELVIDKETLSFKKLYGPTPFPILTWQAVMEKLPATIPWNETLYLTGSIVKAGFSVNDADFITFEVTESKKLGQMRDFFEDILGWKTHVGCAVMPEREPVFLYKIYEKGVKC